MNSLAQLDGLLQEVLELLKSPERRDRRAAAIKLERIVSIASTLALTLRTTHSLR